MSTTAAAAAAAAARKAQQRAPSHAPYHGSTHRMGEVVQKGRTGASLWRTASQENLNAQKPAFDKKSSMLRMVQSSVSSQRIEIRRSRLEAHNEGTAVHKLDVLEGQNEGPTVDPQFTSVLDMIRLQVCCLLSRCGISIAMAVPP